MDALKEPETTVVFRSHSGDTDIMVLAVALLRSDCERLYINYGNGKNRKAICLDDIMMNEKKKDALLGFYTFSGNDYVSGFFRKDISSGWECMVKTKICSAFCRLKQVVGIGRITFIAFGRVFMQLVWLQMSKHQLDTAQNVPKEGKPKQTST